MLTRRLILLAALALPGAACAQGWQARFSDDGAYFEGAVSGPQGVYLACGGPSAGGRTGEEVGNNHARITPPGALELTLTGPVFGVPADMNAVAADLSVHATDGRGYRLPPAGWNAMWDEWTVTMHADSPLWALMAEAPAIDIQAHGRKVRVTTAGFGAAYATLVTQCAQRYAAVGTAWPAALPVAATPVPAAPATMDAAARSYAALACGAPATLAPAALMAANLDGDGVPDAVLDLRGVTCAGQFHQSHCGAAACEIAIFVSRGVAATGQPEVRLGVGARVAPLDNGRDGVVLGGLPTDCNAAPQGTDCSQYLYWTGTELARLP